VRMEHQNGDGSEVLQYRQGGALTDAATLAITAGATQQAVFAANLSRRFFYFQNISDTVMWVNFGANATADTPSISVAVSGGVLQFNSGFCPTGAVNVICATTGKKFVAKEG
jgi:hypothetical protein